MATSTAPPSQDLKAFSEISDVFSVEHGRRSVEVAFLERLISAMEDANKAALLASGKLARQGSCRGCGGCLDGPCAVGYGPAEAV